MKFSVIALLLLAFIAAPFTLEAADKKKKTEQTANGEKVVIGMMGVKPADADKDVVGVIIGKDKKLYKVVATGELAKTIEELRKKGGPLKITGALSDDTIKASKAEEGPVKKK